MVEELDKYIVLLKIDLVSHPAHGGEGLSKCILTFKVLTEVSVDCQRILYIWLLFV